MRGHKVTTLLRLRRGHALLLLRMRHRRISRIRLLWRRVGLPRRRVLAVWLLVPWLLLILLWLLLGWVPWALLWLPVPGLLVGALGLLLHGHALFLVGLLVVALVGGAETGFFVLDGSACCGAGDGVWVDGVVGGVVVCVCEAGCFAGLEEEEDRGGEEDGEDYAVGLRGVWLVLYA